MLRYFRVVRVLKEDKCQAAFLITGGAAGEFVFSLTSNNAQITWDKLRISLEEYYGEVSDPNACIVELANIKQDRTQWIQDYMQRVVHLVKGAYMGANEGTQLVTKQVIGFFLLRT